MTVNCEKISCSLSRSDHRGSFLGLMNQGSWQEVNFVATQAGQVRGGHNPGSHPSHLALFRGQ